MKTINELNADILKITMKIKEIYPELSKYLEEMSIKNNGPAYGGVYIKELKQYNDSLHELLKKFSLEHRKEENVNNRQTVCNKKKDDLNGHIYPQSEDIYNRSYESSDLDPDDLTKKKATNEMADASSEKKYKRNASGSDLDIPGSELDDEQENIGSEDEENNYYSIGGDDHNNLEEDKDELSAERTLQE